MVDKWIGKDWVAELVRGLRNGPYRNEPDWSELEPLLYDKLQDWNALPEYQFNLSDVAGAGSLSDEQQQALRTRLEQHFVEYGRVCRQPLITELVKVYVELFRRRKDG